MKIEQFTLTITRIDNDLQTDTNGVEFLKCKGKQHYKTTIRGNKQINAYNFFSTVRLYPFNQEQAEETKKRLYEQTCSSPKIKILVYDCDLYTNLIGGNICPILNVNKYDFETNKLFDKRRLLKGE